jgi:hypothetical protein
MSGPERNDRGPGHDPPAGTPTGPGGAGPLPVRPARRRHSPWLWAGLATVGAAGLAGALSRAVDGVREAAERSM